MGILGRRKGAKRKKKKHTFGFDENFTRFGSRHVEFFDGEGFISFPKH